MKPIKNKGLAQFNAGFTDAYYASQHDCDLPTYIKQRREEVKKELNNLIKTK